MNKTETKKKCSNILNSGIDNFTLGEDFDFLCDLFKQHPRYKSKTKGQNIVCIKVKRAGRYNTKCFYIVREDGTETDISVYTCIDGKEIKIKDINMACRDAIDPLIYKMRKSVKLPFVCPVSGVIVNSMNDVHIDHYDLDFKDVVSRWIEENGGEDEIYNYISDTNDNETVTYFVNPEIKKNFIDFHNLNTHLRAIHKQANLTIRKKKN